MKEAILKFITFLHILFIIFLLAVPFTSSNYFLLLHAITIPFLIIHWLCNDNTCILTIIEKNLRKKWKKNKNKDKDMDMDTDIEEECFTCKLIEPIYDFNKNYGTWTKITYAITIGVWLISFGKLISKYRDGQFRNWKNLFRI